MPAVIHAGVEDDGARIRGAEKVERFIKRGFQDCKVAEGIAEIARGETAGREGRDLADIRRDQPVLDPAIAGADALSGEQVFADAVSPNRAIERAFRIAH